MLLRLASGTESSSLAVPVEGKVGVAVNKVYLPDTEQSRGLGQLFSGDYSP